MSSFRYANFYVDKDLSSNATYSTSFHRVLHNDEYRMIVDTAGDVRLDFEHSVDASNVLLTESRYLYGGTAHNEVCFPVVSEYGRFSVTNVGSTDTSVTSVCTSRKSGIDNYKDKLNYRIVGNDLGASNFAVGASTAVQTHNFKQFDLYGNADPSTNITVQLSVDGTNYYNSNYTGDVCGNFHMQFDCNAPFFRLNNNDRDTSATVCTSSKLA